MIYSSIVLFFGARGNESMIYEEPLNTIARDAPCDTERKHVFPINIPFVRHV